MTAGRRRGAAGRAAAEMAPLRILMVSALDVWSLAGQGGAPSLFKTLEGLSRHGHAVDFVSPSIGANHHAGAAVLAPPSLSGIRFHRFRLASLHDLPVPIPERIARVDQKLRFALLFPPLAARRAKRLLRRGAYDLLYGYEVHGVLAQRLVRRWAMLPLVTRFQGTVIHPHLGRPLGLLRRYEEVLALRTAADLYVMTNDGTRGAEVLRRLNPASAGKVRFWRNGLDLSSTRPPAGDEAAAARRSLRLRDDELVLVTAARLARWKRIDRAIDAVAALRHAGTGARLLVVGDGEERPALEAQARRLSLSDAVRFVGAVPQTEVVRYLWAADVFLSLNELSNLGNPLLEAMQAGRCILTLDEGDTRSLIQDDVTGVLLASGEPAAIRDAIEALARDRQRRDRLGAAARAVAEREFWSWEQRIDAEVDALEALAGAPAARPAVPA